MSTTETTADAIESMRDDPEAWGDAESAPRRHSEKRQRSALASVRFTPDELESIQAHLVGSSVSGWLHDLAMGAISRADEDEPTVPGLLPLPVADFGSVHLELMGHRVRTGPLAEVTMFGQTFLRITDARYGTEFYAPSSVYCISPATTSPAPVPLAAIPERFNDVLDDDYDSYDEDDDD